MSGGPHAFEIADNGIYDCQIVGIHSVSPTKSNMNTESGDIWAIEIEFRSGNFVVEYNLSNSFSRDKFELLCDYCNTNISSESERPSAFSPSFDDLIGKTVPVRVSDKSAMLYPQDEEAWPVQLAAYGFSEITEFGIGVKYLYRVLISIIPASAGLIFGIQWSNTGSLLLLGLSILFIVFSVYVYIGLSVGLGSAGNAGRLHPNT